MSEIHSVAGSAVPLLLDDIDTDRIIPARYLRCVTFDGLGEHAFEDDRKQDPSHPFNDDRFAGASILLAGRNFGCGSSREHAPQSLMRWGIKAIVAESFAEIFFGNCTTLGIPAVTVDDVEALETIASHIDGDPTMQLTVDLDAMELRDAHGSCPVAMPPEAHEALTTGKWDSLAQLLANQQNVSKTAAGLPYLKAFAG